MTGRYFCLKNIIVDKYVFNDDDRLQRIILGCDVEDLID